jgi:hypothetical protein
MTKVAAELGDSDVAVKKICDKHRIPVPGRGYWAKIAAGQKLRPAPFREIADPLLNRVRIVGSPLNALPEEVRGARARAKTDARVTPPVVETSTLDADGLGPLAQRHESALRSAKAGPDQMVRLAKTNLLHCVLAPTSIPRALRFIDGLGREIDARGIRLDPGENTLVATFEGETIGLTLAEGTDKVRHQPTEAEIDALEKWNIKADKARRRGDWLSGFDKPTIQEFDWVPNGRLSFLIDPGGYHSDGIRRKYADGSRQRLEPMMSEIAVGLITCAAARKAARQAAEQRQREWADQEERRKELERRRTLEAKRVEFLKLQMDVAERARAVEAFVADYVVRYPDEADSPACSAFVRWARAYAERLRASIAPRRLEEILARHALMDDAATVASWLRFDS